MRQPKNRSQDTVLIDPADVGPKSLSTDFENSKDEFDDRFDKFNLGSSSSSILEVYLFGLPKLRVGHRCLNFPTQKSLSVLAKLILSAGRPVSRGALIDLFWGDSPEVKAKKCLNTEVWRIRVLLRSLDLEPNAYLESDADRITFRRGAAYWLDVEAFDDGIAAAFAHAPSDDLCADHLHRLERSVALFDGELMEGCYDEWVLPQRAQATERYVLAMEYLVAAFRERRAYDRAIGHARHLLAVDPYSEAGHFELMLCLFLKGRRCDALRHYRHCEVVFRDELGVEPMAETTWLVDVIKGQLSIDGFWARTSANSRSDPRLIQR